MYIKYRLWLPKAYLTYIVLTLSGLTLYAFALAYNSLTALCSTYVGLDRRGVDNPSYQDKGIFIYRLLVLLTGMGTPTLINLL